MDNPKAILCEKDPSRIPIIMSLENLLPSPTSNFINLLTSLLSFRIALQPRVQILWDLYSKKNTCHMAKSCTPLVANGGIESSAILEVRVKLC